MENKGARFLAFDSLKGLKEAIESVDSFTTGKRYPHLSEEMRDSMDNLLYTAYLHKLPVHIAYLHYRKECQVSDVISELDAVRHKIILSSGQSIYLSEIRSMELCNEILFTAE